MFETPEGPRLIQAAGLAMAVMRVTKKPWSESMDDLPPDLVLSTEQRELLSEFTDILHYIHPSVAADRTVSIYVCEDCGSWGFIASGTAPKKCNLKLWCEGAVHKAKIATKAAA